jgi:hypothetical protein
VTDAEDLKATAGKSAIAKMAKALQVDAVLLGSVSKSNDLTVMVYKPDGRLVDQIKVKGGTSSKLESAIQNEFDVTIAPPLAEASGAKLSRSGRGSRGSGAAPVEEEEEEEPEAVEAAPAAAEPAAEPAEGGGEEEPPVEAEPEKDTGGKGGGSKKGRTPLEIDAGFRAYSRAFEWTGVAGTGVRNPTSPRTVRPYNLSVAPALILNGVFYPGAFFTDGFAANIGLMGGAELGVATSTDYERAQPDGSKLVTPLKTTAQSWDVGLRGRIPIGPLEIALFAEYGTQTFILLGDEGGNTGLSPLVPDVKYTFIRLGLEPRVEFSKVIIGAHIAPRVLTSLHQLDLKGVWFSHVKGRGLDFGLMGGYAIAPFFAVVGGLDFVGYGFDFNPIDPKPEVDPLAVGGATDSYKSIWLAARFSIGGK